MSARVAMMATVVLVALLLQTVVLSSVTIAGWRPDLVALTVVAFALVDGPDTGARYGFSAGLAADLLAASGVVGLSALVLMLLGAATGGLRVYLTGTAWLGESALAAALAAGGYLGYGLLALLLDLEQFTVVLVVQGALVQGLWGLLLAPLVVRPVARLSRRFPGAELLPGQA